MKITTVQGDLDLSSPVGRMFATILIAVAEYEAAHKGERQQAAEAKNAADGKRRRRPPPVRVRGRLRDRAARRGRAIRWAADALLGGATVSR